MSLLFDVLVLVGLIALSAFASASESAIFSLGRYHANVLFANKVRGSKNLKKLLDKPQRLLITLLLFNTVVNIGASVYATMLFANFFKSNVIGITTGIMTFLILVFGEITPKTIALKYNKSISLSFSTAIRTIQIILYPFVYIFDIFVTEIHKLLRVKNPSSAMTKEELKGILALSEKEGSIKSSEQKMIAGVFKFGDKYVSDVMMPRTKIIFGRASMKLADIVGLSKQTGHSRFPVYEKDRDNIIGMVYLKDVLSYVSKGKLNLPIETIIKKATIIPETNKLGSTLKLFQKGRVHMAVVVDEYGGVVGLVTLEDILEEIVGEIFDEAEKSGPKIVRLNKDTYRIAGDADLELVRKKIGIKIEGSHDVDTFGGYITATLGKIPKKGEEIHIKNLVVVVEDVYRNRITSVRAYKK